MDEKIVHREIREANKDFEDRLRTSLLDLQYDHDADLLYLTFGSPKEAFSFDEPSAEDVVYLRIALDTYQIVGMDIHHFRALFLARHPDWKASFDLFFDELGQGDFRICMELHPPGDLGKVEIGRIGIYVPKKVRELGRVHTKRSASKMSANEMNPRKITSSFSKREKMRRNPFNRRKSLSISLRLLYISRSYSHG